MSALGLWVPMCLLEKPKLLPVEDDRVPVYFGLNVFFNILGKCDGHLITQSSANLANLIIVYSHNAESDMLA